MAPEQWQGQALDARVDVYALGVMVYEMLAGSTPFSADTPFAMMHRHIYETPPLLREFRPELPARTSDVIAKALSKESRNRYSSAGEMARAFREALQEKQTGAIAESPLASAPTMIDGVTPQSVLSALPPTRAHRSRRWIAPAAIGVFLLIVVAVVLIGASRGTSTTAEPTSAAGAIAIIVELSLTPTLSATPTSLPSSTPTVAPTFTLTSAPSATLTLAATAIAISVLPTQQPTLTAIPPTQTVTASSTSSVCDGVFVDAQLTIGMRGVVTPGLNNLVNTKPARPSLDSSSQTIAKIPPGSTFTVIDGPVCQHKIRWWKVNYNGVIGWTGEAQGRSYWSVPVTP
jgi:serine/threonine protein kinase